MVLEYAAFFVCLILAVMLDPKLAKQTIKKMLGLRQMDVPTAPPRKVKVLKNGTLREFSPEQIQVDPEQNAEEYFEWLEEQSEKALRGEAVDSDFASEVEKL